MPKHTFYKYQGTGNDFVIVDHRKNKWIEHDDIELINQLCDRRFGIGADGLILLEDDSEVDFKMVYFNSDGQESSMCGNGGRCLVAFANAIGLIDKRAKFMAIDGLHEAEVLKNEIKLKMGDVGSVSGNAHEFILNTGSPHYVRFVQDLKAIDIIEEGKKIRYSEVHKAEGINVNIVEVNGDYIDVQTYERGVEWETLSCGTGVTACALAFHLYTNQTNSTNEVKILTKGGSLRVQFEYNAQSGKFSNIWLIGPAELVYEGIWND